MICTEHCSKATENIQYFGNPVLELMSTADMYGFTAFSTLALQVVQTMFVSCLCFREYILVMMKGQLVGPPNARPQRTFSTLEDLTTMS